MMRTEIQRRLFALKDEKYRDFSAGLNPSVDKSGVIGVRLPAIRALAKELKGTQEEADFLCVLPHKYFEEYHLHGFLIAYTKDFDEAAEQVEQLLPYIDNWAVCDSLRMNAFKRQPERLLPRIERWLDSKHTYTIRYGMLCLMNYFLDERFRSEYLHDVTAAINEEYYVKMMAAWYFATALAKQYDATLPYIEEKRLPKWVHNKTIQKAVESYRVSDKQKAYLKTLRIK